MHRSKRHLHSITSSERACRLGGISKPSVRKAGRTCEPQKSRHVSRRSARKRLVESDRQLTYADADRLVESVGAPSPPSNRANRRLRSARIACPPARGSTNRTKGMSVVQKTITKAIFFTGAQNASTANVCTNLLVRCCWEFLFRWRNLGLLPFRICRRAPIARIRVAQTLRWWILADPLARTYRVLFAVVAPALAGPAARFPPRYVPLQRPRNDCHL